MTVALKVQDLIGRVVHPTVSDTSLEIVKRAREEAFTLGKTPFIEPTHLVSSILAYPNGAGIAIIKNHLTTSDILQLRRMLSENDWKNDFRVRDGLMQDSYTLDFFFDIIHSHRTYEDAIFSTAFDQVLIRASENSK